ncbi:hypothetical protein BH23THE1_BH23THE1_29340 [soil metagenome]
MLESGQQKPVEVPREKITLQQWKDSLILGVTLSLGGQGLLTWGAQYLTSGMTGFLNSTIPLWVAILGYLIYRWFKKDTLGKKMSRGTILGLVAGFGGLILLVGPSIGSGDLDPIGTVALIISSISWAIGSIYSTRAQLPVSILASAGMIMITGGLMLTCVSFLIGEYKSLDLMQVSLISIIAQIYLIGIITVVGFTDFYWLLRVTSASLANTFAYVSPVIAVLLGWAVLHENLSLITVVAMVVILAGVALMVTKKKDPGKSKQIQSSQQKYPIYSRSKVQHGGDCGRSTVYGSNMAHVLIREYITSLAFSSGLSHYPIYIDKPIPYSSSALRNA